LETTSNVQVKVVSEEYVRNERQWWHPGARREHVVPNQTVAQRSSMRSSVILSAHITIFRATVSVTGHDVLCKDFREIKQHENTVSVLPCIPENSNTQISSLGSLAYSYSASGPSLQARVASNVEPPFNR